MGPLHLADGLTKFELDGDNLVQGDVVMMIFGFLDKKFGVYP